MKSLCLTVCLIALFGSACGPKMGLQPGGDASPFGGMEARSASGPAREPDADTGAATDGTEPGVGDTAPGAASNAGSGPGAPRAFDTTSNNPGPLGPVAESKRLPDMVFAYSAYYGENFEHMILPEGLSGSNPGFTAEPGGLLTVPLKLEIRVDRGGTASSYEDLAIVLVNGPQVRLVFEKKASRGESYIDTGYMDVVTSLLTYREFPNATFWDVPVDDNMRVRVLVYDKAANVGFQRSPDFSITLRSFASVAEHEAFLANADFAYVGSAKIDVSAELFKLIPEKRAIPTLNEDAYRFGDVLRQEGGDLLPAVPGKR